MPGLKKPIPFEFVLEALARLEPHTRPMFGCTAVYAEDKIMLVLRDKGEKDEDSGVWLATTHEHHASLKRELPSMRSIRVFGTGVTGWQVLPSSDAGFEDEVQRACELILAGDPRIGKVPKPRKPKSAKRKSVKAKARPLQRKRRA
jgi:hypothetical protein